MNARPATYLCDLPAGYEEAARALVFVSGCPVAVHASPLEPPLFINLETGAQWCLLPDNGPL